MELTPELQNFLLLNPYPSLSFLPLQMENGEEKLVFFLQDKKKHLSVLHGKLITEISFYAESDCYVMRLSFTVSKISSLKTPYFNKESISLEFPVYETEFLKRKSGIDALKLLSGQDDFPMILYDRQTGYMFYKTFTFHKKNLLRFLKIEKLI